MSYESDCNDYAVNGDPERDHWDYEANADYDQFDGRDLFDHCGEQADRAGCPDGCDCVDCSPAPVTREWLDSNPRNDCDDSIPF